jgi:hypothetical protein
MYHVVPVKLLQTQSVIIWQQYTRMKWLQLRGLQWRQKSRHIQVQQQMCHVALQHQLPSKSLEIIQRIILWISEMGSTGVSLEEQHMYFNAVLHASSSQVVCKDQV